jgi:sec-independent protein translocase protein TatC
MLGAGLMFEVPVAMLALARIGVTSAAFYVRHWRVAIVLIAVLAAILPGGDPFSMLLLMIPQIALYGLGIWLARRFGGPPLWARDAWAAEEEGPGSAPGQA